MLLRRVIQHVKTQNWTAVGLDFVIVVTGVFIGIQLGNWNEARTFKDREVMLLRELRDEAEQNIADSRAKGKAFGVVAEAGRRILGKINQERPPCSNNCWVIIADLMHASQWQQLSVSWSTYDELRRDGLPTDRRIIEAVEEFQVYSHQSAMALSVQPPYRSLVRRLIPIELQDAYWDQCYRFDRGVETYVDPCPVPDGVIVESALVDRIFAHPELAQSLREWVSLARI
ncbi:MAG: hypothetical protein KJN99_02355, partial [Marinicaulis sp.]|nr:hypothetical protein [Marinicaulis sp.]